MYEYNQVEQLLKEEKINEAQQILDDATDRDAEWHYLQSVVFYKKNWMNESKKQLEIAVDMDQTNSKYKEELEKLNRKINSNNERFHSGNANSGYNRPGDRQMGGDMGGCLECCAYTLCLNACCNCCR